MRKATQLVGKRGPMAATRFIRNSYDEQHAPPPPVDIDANVEVVDPVRKGRVELADATTLGVAERVGQVSLTRYSGHAGARNSGSTFRPALPPRRCPSW